MTRVRAVVTGLVLAALLGSCASVRNGLGTRDAVCFAALPAAQHEVGKAASFAGVRYLSPDSLVDSIERGAHRRSPPPREFRAMTGAGACLVAFRGRFSGSLVASAWRPQSGPYDFAVVVVRQDDQHILGVLLLRRSPLHFVHLS